MEALFEGTLNCVALLDRDFNFIRVNKAYAASCGREVDDFPGRNHFNLYPSDARLIFENVIATKQPCEVLARPFEYPDHPEWGVTYWDWTLMPILDASGEVAMLALNLRDVTASRRLEIEREATLDLLQIISETPELEEVSSEICTYLRSRFPCEAISFRLRYEHDFPICCAIGFSEEFAEAERSLCGFDEDGRLITDEQGQPVLHCLCGHVAKAAMRRGRPWSTADGSFWTGDTEEFLKVVPEEELPTVMRGRCPREGYRTLVIIPLHVGGQTIGLMHFCDHDPHRFAQAEVQLLERVLDNVAVALAHRFALDDLRTSERDYRDLVQNVSSIVLRVDRKGFIRFANRFAHQFFGYEDGGLVGQPILGMIIPPRADDSGRDLSETLAEVMAHPENYARHESENITRDGRRVWVTWRNQAVYDEYGRLRELLAIGTDLTEHKLAERELLDYQAKLRSLAADLSLAEQRERRRLADGIHDDIVQALAIQKMQLQLLAGQQPANAETLTEIITGITGTIERLRSLSFDLSPAVLYKLGLVSAIEWLSARMIQQHGYHVSVAAAVEDAELSEDLQVVLYQTVRELLVNIAKHAAARQVRIELTRQGDRLALVVEDDGQGFDPQRLGAGSSKGGYGLFSLQERLMHLGGNLGVESSPGQGAHFRAWVPLAPPGPEA